MICRDLRAIKNIQKRGGVSAVAANMGGDAAEHVPVPIKVPPTPGLLGLVKSRLVEVLLPYHPQGLVVGTLQSEYENMFEEPLPLQVGLPLHVPLYAPLLLQIGPPLHACCLALLDSRICALRRSISALDFHLRLRVGSCDSAL